MSANGAAVEVVCVTGVRPYDRYGRAGSQPVSCPVCWQGPDSYRDVPRASKYGAIFAPGLTERSERQASRCARALSRSRYK
jgi:hypothetical protein